MGSASPHFPKYSPILVGSEIMPSAELCVYIVILNEEFDLLSYMASLYESTCNPFHLEAVQL